VAIAVALLLVGSAAGQTPSTRGPAEAVTTGCVTGDCHSEQVRHKHAHAPAAQRKCEACHELRSAREHDFELRLPAERLCLQCHIIKRPDFLHAPVRDGNCTGCHDPHGSDLRLMLRADPVEGLCGQCHDAGPMTAHAFVHAPVASGACVLCHEAHGSWQPHLLVESGRRLCVSCHQATEAQLRQKGFDHPPAAEGECSACHDPHASDLPAQLISDVPALCTSCHADVGQRIARAATVHEVVRDDRACVNCHQPHAASHPALLDQQPAELCLSCHNRRVTTRQGDVLEDMAALLAENPYHHGPIRNGDCAACHDPHASDHFRLLTNDYPAQFYAPFRLDLYDLCFNCHVRELVLEPFGAGITGFARQTEQGIQNLHYVHVNQKKGRTCRACHEVHASRQPFHMRESVPFGAEGWPLAINFNAEASGGSCAPACHKPETYRRPDPPGRLETQDSP